VTAEIAENLGFKGTKGALVAEPQPESPAAKAGIKSGDIITSLNGDAVENPCTLSKKIAAAVPGMPVKLGVFRQGNEELVQGHARRASEQRSRSRRQVMRPMSLSRLGCSYL
jgi:serine protease Do